MEAASRRPDQDRWVALHHHQPIAPAPATRTTNSEDRLGDLNRSPVLDQPGKRTEHALVGLALLRSEGDAQTAMRIIDIRNHRAVSLGPRQQEHGIEIGRLRYRRMAMADGTTG